MAAAPTAIDPPALPPRRPSTAAPSALPAASSDRPALPPRPSAPRPPSPIRIVPPTDGLVQHDPQSAPIVGVTPATPPLSPPSTAPVVPVPAATIPTAPSSTAETVKDDLQAAAQQVRSTLDRIPQEVATDPSLYWLGLSVALAGLAYARIPPFWLLVVAFLGYLAITQHVAPRHERVVRPGVEARTGGSESDAVSWVNHILYSLFPLISTDVLTPFIDLLEDALAEQVPPVITSTRIVSPALGSQPVVLTAMRPLSDEEWFALLSKPGPSGNMTDVVSGKSSKLRHVFKPGFKDKAADGDAQRNASLSGGASHSRSASASSSGSVQSAHSSGDQGQARRRRDRILSKVTGRRGQTGTADGGSDVHDGRGHGAGLGEAGAGLDEQLKHAAGGGEEESDDSVGQYVNYQTSFEYVRTKETEKKGYGLHMLAYFGWGVKGLGGGEIPIYLDVLSIKGTLNLRLLLSASPPFVRSATFSFQSLPEFELSAKPLRNVGFGSFNAMDIGPLRSYAQASIAQVAKAFVAPERYSLDVDRLLLGREAALRTAAVGVLEIVIHGARDLLKADTMGTCDPYIAISFSKFNKPMFSTRTIIDTQDPVWEEPAFILVSDDAIVAGEKVCIRAFDSDRLSADDSIGLVTLDLAELVDSASSEMVMRHDKFAADQPGMRTSGELDWSVRFCPLWSMPEDDMRRKVEEVRDRRRPGPTEDESAGPWWLRPIMERYILKPAWEIEREHKRKETLAWFAGEKERDELEAMAKPSEEHKSGILQFHIHQASDLELESRAGTYSAQINRRKSAALGKPALADVADRTPAENPDPPSAYCEVHLNDKFVYRTRTKQVTPYPFYNAVSERFVADWTKAKIVFVMRDERNREHDPILGIVSLRLKDLFQDGCQFTRWFPVIGGLGWGRLRLSLLFKPVDVQLPPSLSGYDVATLAVTSFTTTDLTREFGKRLSVMVETEYDRFVMSPPEDDSGSGSTTSVATRDSAAQNASLTPSRSTASLAADDLEMQYVMPNPIRLAVQYRHSCSAVITFFTRSGVMRKRKVVAIAILPLADVGGDSGRGGTGIVDGSGAVERVVPVFRTASVPAAVHASQVFRAHQTAGEPETPRADESVTLAGFAGVAFELHEGVSRAHRKVARRDLRFASVMEAWEVGRMLHVAGGGIDRVEDGGDVDADDADEDDEDSESDDDEEVGGGKGGAAGEPLGRRKTMEDEDDEAFANEKRSHSKALHRNHRGIFQLKVARTGRFVKDKLAAKYYATAGAGRLDSRPRGGDVEVEREGQSHM